MMIILQALETLNIHITVIVLKQVKKMKEEDFEKIS